MIFYQCPKCKNKWQYNISKCPECFLDLERIKGEKASVIGISKTNIPSILHPETPYYILVLEDEHKNRWAHKSMKEYGIGDELAINPIKDKNSVSIWKMKYDTLEPIERVVELIGGVNIDADSKILILPTLISAKHPYLAYNSNPAFLENTIKFLIGRGADTKNIKIAGQSFDQTPIEAIAQKAQLLNVCMKYKIMPLDLSKTKFIKKETSGMSFEISKEAFENDLLVNLPILKLDKEKAIAGAANNLLALLKKESRLFFSKNIDYQNLLKALHEIMPEHLNLAEAGFTQRSDKYVAYMGTALASWNAKNLDRVFAEIAMKSDLPEYLKDIKIEHIQIAGRRIQEVKFDFEKAY